MAAQGSVSRQIRELKAGLTDAEGLLYTRYFKPLAAMAAASIRRISDALIDDETAADSALLAVLERIKAGEGGDILTSNDLLTTLLNTLKEKIKSRRRKETAAKRGGGKVQSVDDFDALLDRAFLDRLGRRAPTPEDLIRLLQLESDAVKLLPDEESRCITLLCLAEYKKAEISSLLRIPLRTLERKLQLIRATWRKNLDPNAYYAGSRGGRRPKRKGKAPRKNEA
jgi:DNA-directed RNA polymerase specialized sigma24 family protein